MQTTQKESGIERAARTIHEGVEGVVAAVAGQERQMTRATGCPIAHMKNSLTAGSRGPVLLQDVEFLEKAQHFDREKIPPRNVHALGNGAYGSFTVKRDISNYTKAKVFQLGTKTDIFVRFSGVFTELGEADTTRDLRGFAIKFYTEEGNWDLLGINTPVFNVRDGKVGPDAIHAFKRDPRTFEWNDESVWDFACNHPESLHQTLMIHSDRVGTPKSFRFMHGYGCNTFSLINDKNQRFWVKFHMLTEYKATGLTDTEAKLIAGEDPDWLKRDLREAIERGDYPKWRFAIQAMPEEEGYRYPWTFDCTKVWPHAQFPLIDVGVLELNRNPTNYFSEVEQIAFSPSSVVPGISFSPDKLLQARLFIYSDTQFHRLGPNYLQIPINQPKEVRKVETQNPAGAHNHEVANKFPGYYPSFNGGPKPNERLMEPPLKIGDAAYYYDYAYEGADADFYEQPRMLFQQQFDQQERENTIYNIAVSLAAVRNQTVVDATIDHLAKIDPQLGGRVKELRLSMISGKTVETEAQRVWKRLHSEVSMNKVERAH
jgi:catalase